jgi:hypothetical protein
MITKERSEQLKELRNDLINIIDIIDDVLDNKCSMAKFARAFKLDPQQLNHTINGGLHSLLNNLKIFDSNSIVELLNDSASASERAIAAIFTDEPKKIILTDIEDEKFIKEAKKHLNPNELYILKHMYGFDNAEILTTSEIANRLGLTNCRIHQLKLRIMRKLRNCEFLKTLLPEYNDLICSLNEVKIMQKLANEVNEEKEHINNNRKPYYKNITIDRIGFSTRAYNCLHRNGINNLDDLASKSVEQISNFRNIGARTLEEIIDIVEEKYGLILK